MARALLGTKFQGILVTDRFSAYNWYPVRWRQLCWAHLLRDIEAMIGRSGRSKEIGETLQSRGDGRRRGQGEKVALYFISSPHPLLGSALSLRQVPRRLGMAQVVMGNGIR